MDPTTFKTWLGGIALLTDPQRRSAWQALELSEEAAAECERLATSEHTPTQTRQAPMDHVRRSSLPAPQIAANPESAASIADLGQCRVDSVGCPHRANRYVVRW